MTTNLTEHDLMMAERIFHGLVMKKMLEKCVEKSIPCNN